MAGSLDRPFNASFQLLIVVIEHSFLDVVEFLDQPLTFACWKSE